MARGNPTLAIQTHFAALEDPRLDRTRLHDLLDMVVSASGAVLCGADGWEDIAKYGRAKQDWLQTCLRLPNGIPSHDTFRRVCCLLEPSAFHDCFQHWSEAFSAGFGLKRMASDGKTMRRSLTKAPLGGKKTGNNPTDRAKKGVKHSLLVEADGLPVGLAVDGANRPDSQLVEETLDSIPVDRPAATPAEPQGLCLDKASVGDEVAELAQQFHFTLHIPPKGTAAQQVKQQAGAKARRWVVERTHSWRHRFRGILIRWNKKPANYSALLPMAFAFIIYRRMGLTG